MHEYELYHFGIKGMHWGIRKDPYSGYNRIKRPKRAKSSKNLKRKSLPVKSNRISQKQAMQLAIKKSGLTKEQKIAIGVAIGAAVLVGGSIYMSHKNDKIGGFNYNNCVKAGSPYGNQFVANLGPMPLHRLSKDSESPEDIMGRPFYASYLPSDVRNYRANYADQIKSKLQGKEYVEEKLIRVKGGKINVADESDGLKVFEKAMKSDSGFVTKMKDFLDDDRIVTEGMKRNYGWDPDTKTMPHDGWYRMLLDGNGHGKDWNKFEAARKALFGKLKDSGYQAIIDTNDTHNYGSKKPLIVFDPSSVVKSVKEKPLTDRKIKTAQIADFASDVIKDPVWNAQFFYYNAIEPGKDYVKSFLAKEKDNAKKRAKVTRYTLDYLKNLE